MDRLRVKGRQYLGRLTVCILCMSEKHEEIIKTRTLLGQEFGQWLRRDKRQRES